MIKRVHIPFFKIKIKPLFLPLLFLCMPQVICADSGKIRSYTEYIAFTDSLGKQFSKENIGAVKYGSYEYPLYKLVYNKKPHSQNVYLIIAGVHGNESAPVFALRDFIIRLNNEAPQREDLSIEFLCVANPCGFEFNQRYNGEGKDINRDMILLETQEGKIIAAAFQKKNYKKVFDFHEASAQNFFLYCYGTKNKSYAENILNLLKNERILLDIGYEDKILKTENGMLYVPFYASAYMHSKKMLTIGLYYAGCENSFTFETPKRSDFAERKRTVGIILNYILGN